MGLLPDGRGEAREHVAGKHLPAGMIMLELKFDRMRWMMQDFIGEMADEMKPAAKAAFDRAIEKVQKDLPGMMEREAESAIRDSIAKAVESYHGQAEVKLKRMVQEFMDSERFNEIAAECIDKMFAKTIEDQIHQLRWDKDFITKLQVAAKRSMRRALNEEGA